MENFKWRVRTSVLWVIYAVVWAGYAMIDLIRPGVIEEVMAGKLAGWQIDSGLLVFLALWCWLIPLTMAFLSLILGDSATRWVSIILGVVAGLLGIVDVVGEITAAPMPVANVLMSASKIVVAALIAWHGWRWPL